MLYIGQKLSLNGSTVVVKDSDGRPKSDTIVKLQKFAPESGDKGVKSTGSRNNTKANQPFSRKDPLPNAPKPLEASPISNITNYEEFVNRSSNDAQVAVIIASGKEINGSLGSGVKDLYVAEGFSSTASLFTQQFVKSEAFSEVENGQLTTLQKLNLPSSVKYIVLGKYSNEFEAGSLTKYISRAKLKVSIISCSSKSQIASFLINSTNGYDDKDNAEAGAIEKILKDYKSNHLNL